MSRERDDVLVTATATPDLIAELHEWAAAHPEVQVAREFEAQFAQDSIRPRTLDFAVKVRRAMVPAPKVDAVLVALSKSNPCTGDATCTAPEHVVSCAAVVPEVKPEQAISILPGITVLPGVYTVETGDRHYTFAVEIMASDSKFAPGAMVVSYLRGRDNTADYTGFAFVKPGNELVFWKKYRDDKSANLRAAAEQFIADPATALEMVHCARCGRPLTVPASVHNGFGPECVKMGLK